MIEGPVIVGSCIYPFGAHAFHQVGVFIGKPQLSGLDGQLIDFLADGFFFYRVGFFGHLVVLGDDFLVDRFFFRPVQRAYLVCSFKHDVLQVVCKSRVLFGVVDGTGTYAYQSEHVRFGFIFPYIYGKTVLQLERLQSLSEGGQGNDEGSQQKK